MSDIIVGIDPGASGGIAWNHDGYVQVFKMPDTMKDIHELLKIAAWAGKCFCYIEKVGPMPGQGVTSMFNFGRGYGALLMALTALKIPFEEVRPQKWKKEFGLIFPKKLGLTQTQVKNKDKAKAQQLFPMFKKITHAHADALLIMEYGRRIQCSRQA